MSKKLALMTAMFVFAGGCMMIPDYTQPEAPVPIAWPGDQNSDLSSGIATNARAAMPWREFYFDERLQKIIELALENNRDLRAAGLRIEKTREIYRIQRAELLPTLDASGLGMSQQLFADVETFEKSVRVEYYTINVGFSSYELDFFGRMRSLKARALEKYLATGQARRGLQISLMAEIAASYLNLAAAHERLGIAGDTLANREASLALVRRRHEIGEASKLEVHRARTLVESARVDMAKYTGQLALDRNALTLLAGAEVPQELLPDDLGIISAIREIDAGLPSEVLQQRPDIMEAENQLKAANAHIGAARAAFFPSITLTGNYGTMDDQLSGLFTVGSWVWAFTPKITLPIFDSGRNTSRLGAAKIDRDIALAQYEKAIQTAFREVADALARRSAILSQLEAQEALAQAAAAAHRLSDVRYRHGEAGYLSVLDAQRELYTARQGLVALRLAGLANRVQLYKALGGG